jgi:RNA polymerase sigma-70 factor (ECF subfamily)
MGLARTRVDAVPRRQLGSRAVAQGRGALENGVQPDDTTAGGVAALMYERYSARIHRACADRLGDRDEAADAVQDTFLRAWLALQGGAEVRYPLPWLLTIADNVCVSRFRAREARLATTALTDGAAMDFSEAVGEVAGLADAFRALPVRQRQALLRREIQGYSYDEIGAELGVSRASVAALLHRARLAVADALREARRGIAALVPVPAVLRVPFENGAATGAAVASTAVVAVTQLAGAGPVSPAQPPPSRTTEAITVLASPSTHVLATRRVEPSAGTRTPASHAAPEAGSTSPEDARSGAEPGGTVGVLGATRIALTRATRIALTGRTSPHLPRLSPAEPGPMPAADPETSAPPAADDAPPPAAPTPSPQGQSDDTEPPPGKQPRGERGRSEHAPGREGKPERTSRGSKDALPSTATGPDDKSSKGTESVQPTSPGESPGDPPPGKPEKDNDKEGTGPNPGGPPDDKTNEGKKAGHGKGDKESP